MLNLVYEYPYLFGVVVPTAFMVLALWALFSQSKHAKKMRDMEKTGEGEAITQSERSKIVPSWKTTDIRRNIMSGVGFNKYFVRQSVTNRQSRGHGRSQAAEAEEAAEASKFGWVKEDVAELKLAVATMLNLLVKQGNLSREDLV